MSEELGAPVPAEPKLCCMGGHPAGCQCNSAKVSGGVVHLHTCWLVDQTGFAPEKKCTCGGAADVVSFR